MKIKYEFANGEVTEVEVNDEVGTFIVDSRRIESNGDRRQRYHNYSLDSVDFEGVEFGYCDNDTLVLEEEQQYIEEMLSTLTDTQRRRFLMYSDGMTYQKISDIEGVHLDSVYESVNAARKKLKKFLQNTPKN